MHRLNTVLIATLVAAQTAAVAQTDAAKVPAGQVSFYSVPLACTAARGLGCGSAAKPVLQALEKKSSIQEAWLDHPGTTLAIVWKKNAKANLRAAEIESVADDRGITLHEITSARRGDTFKSFATRNGWYRGSELDRLSEEEVSVIVDRLVRRVMAKEPTIGSKVITQDRVD